MLLTVFVLFVTRDLGIDPALYGLILAASGVGALFGVLASSRVSAWVGMGPAVIVAQAVTALGGIFYPLATSASLVSVVMLICGQAIWGFSRPILNINQVSLRQNITPDRLLGRMTASIRFVMWGLPPIGSIVGGVLGSVIGLRETLVLVIAGEIISTIWYALSPLRTIREEADAQTVTISR